LVVGFLDDDDDEAGFDAASRDANPSSLDVRFDFHTCPPPIGFDVKHSAACRHVPGFEVATPLTYTGANEAENQSRDGNIFAHAKKPGQSPGFVIVHCAMICKLADSADRSRQPPLPGRSHLGQFQGAQKTLQ
jgi:hypothetical protein